MTPLVRETALLIKTVQHRHHRRLDSALAELGVSLVQWNALREIARNPGSSMHALAELTFNSDQAFGMLVKRLLDAELVRRAAGTGRVLTHSLTPKGRSLLDRGQKIYDSVLGHAFHAMPTAQVAQLQQLLGQLA